LCGRFGVIIKRPPAAVQAKIHLPAMFHVIERTELFWITPKVRSMFVGPNSDRKKSENRVIWAGGANGWKGQ
jgi:hypothetical protein